MFRIILVSCRNQRGVPTHLIRERPTAAANNKEDTSSSSNDNDPPPCPPSGDPPHPELQTR